MIGSMEGAAGGRLSQETNSRTLGWPPPTTTADGGGEDHDELVM